MQCVFHKKRVLRMQVLQKQLCSSFLIYVSSYNPYKHKNYAVKTFAFF